LFGRRGAPAVVAGDAAMRRKPIERVTVSRCARDLRAVL
jgi:hypothetical protein